MGRAHSNAWRQAPKFFNLKANVELHTICGRHSAGVQAARAQLGWQNSTTDWREIAESPLIDILLDIVTPTNFHAEMAIAAVKNGKHVLCEKPLGLDLKECEQMLAAAQKAKVVHMVCHNYRRIPAIALAKRMISEGALGRIYHFRARATRRTDWPIRIFRSTGVCKKRRAAAVSTATSIRTSLTSAVTLSANLKKFAES